MKRGIASALIIAVVLIGGASWYRFAGGSSYSAGLVAVDKQPLSEAQYEELLATFLNTDDSATTEPLTNTDLIGRQLILDYVGLARDGQASAENLNLLAENYVDSLPTLSPSLQVHYSEIKAVSDVRVNLEKYNQEMTAILTNYQRDFQTLNNQKGIDLSVLNSAALAFFEKIGGVYENTASKLLAVETPQSFFLLHLQLVNTYLTNAEAMRAIAMNNSDSAKAFAGIIAMNDGIAKERMVIEEMNRILASYGI